ncbi:hypothetical protein KUCAC02_003576 [Chaenocephalus aceratus]|uniref:Uncharacterized protein n=1 Tax=Chaenocephalus aceratus TaxID=36190 RepID=A0ACB9WLY5_CHAAC|nr:hypothetical protein KUCAC02_003576 [Chaenocephalus aceratus]
MFPISSYFVYAVKPSSSLESPEVEETHEIPLQVPSLVCLLPIPPPSQICFCGPSQDFTIIPGKQTVLVTINGLLPPEDDVTGRICSDTFHRVFREFAFCNYRQEDLCLVEPFKCPACTPDMLAIAVDGNRKHYRFKKSRGTDEPSLFDGLFIAQDSKVSAFVDKIRSQMTIALDKLDHLLHQTKDDIRNQISPSDITEEGYRGLHCCLLHHQYLLEQKLSRVTSTYSCIGTDSSFLMMQEDIEDGDEDNEQDGDEDNEQDGDEDNEQDGDEDNKQDGDEDNEQDGQRTGR